MATSISLLRDACIAVFDGSKKFDGFFRNVRIKLNNKNQTYEVTFKW